jgi:ribose 5-phosphate isomerase B
VANKINGIRCALAVNEENVTLAREHNDANVLSLGSIFVTDEHANKLAKLFLITPFSNEERHERRIEKITKLEVSNGN